MTIKVAGTAATYAQVSQISQDLMGVYYVPITGVAADDAAAINTATLAAKNAGGGEVVIGPGTLTMSSSTHRILIYGGVKIRGRGLTKTKIIAPTGASTFALFSHEETTQSVYFSLDDIWIYGYNSDCQGFNSKVNAGTLWDIHIGRGVYFEGFGNGNATNTAAVVYIGDPWGLRFNGIIEQCGDRPALIVEATGASTDNCVISQAKITNNAGGAIKLIGCDYANINECILGSTGNSKSVLILDACERAMVSNNIVRGYASSSGQIAFDLTGATVAAIITSNALVSNGAGTSTGIRVGSSCSFNNINNNLVTSWTTPITDSAGDTVYDLITTTAEASRTAEHPGYQANVYYYPEGYLSSYSAGALTANIVYLVPMFIGERTNFVRIGVNVTTAVGASTLRMGIYRAVGGVPTSLVSGSDSGTQDSSTTGVKESTIDVNLSRGWYFLGVTASDAISLTFQLNCKLSSSVGSTTAVTLDSFPYLSPGSYGALASTAGTMLRGNLSDTIPVIWLRRT